MGKDSPAWILGSELSACINFMADEPNFISETRTLGGGDLHFFLHIRRGAVKTRRENPDAVRDTIAETKGKRSKRRKIAFVIALSGERKVEGLGPFLFSYFQTLISL